MFAQVGAELLTNAGNKLIDGGMEASGLINPNKEIGYNIIMEKDRKMDVIDTNPMNVLFMLNNMNRQKRSYRSFNRRRYR